MATRRLAGLQTQNGVDTRTAEESLRFAEVFSEAVQAAREENRRLGIANVQVDEDGRLTEELPDGSVRPVATR
jgi:hypothetical protein